MPPKRCGWNKMQGRKRKSEDTEGYRSPQRCCEEGELVTPVTPPYPVSKSEPEDGEGKGDKVKAEETEDFRSPQGSDDENESASPAMFKPEVGKAWSENQPLGAAYSFTEEQEEEIAHWVESESLLYNMKDRHFKDKALRRRLWEGKAAEYGVDYYSIQKWYHTQRTRFSKLPQGQPKKKNWKRSGGGVSSGDEEDLILGEEAIETDSYRDSFIRRIFGFLKPHIRRHKKDTPARFKEKFALPETGETPWCDNSPVTSSLADEPRQLTKKYTGYSTQKLPSRTRTAAEQEQPEFPGMEMRVIRDFRDLQDRLVQFITREQQVKRATPFCKYLETELDQLHDACVELAYEEITTVLNHYRKVSRKFRMWEAAGEKISPLADVPSALQLPQPQQQRLVAAAYSRVQNI